MSKIIPAQPCAKIPNHLGLSSSFRPAHRHQRQRLYSKSSLCQIIGNLSHGKQLSQRRKGDKGKAKLARQHRQPEISGLAAGTAQKRPTPFLTTVAAVSEMNNDASKCGKDSFEARAAPSSYFALAGIWFVLGMAYGLLALSRPLQGMLVPLALCISCGVAWIIWLRGFRIRISPSKVEYRNGLYNLIVIPLNEVTEVQNTYVEWKILTRSVRAPRMVVIYGKQSDRVTINIKPFRNEDVRTLLNILKRSQKGVGAE
jgi:hypothetical protein